MLWKCNHCPFTLPDFFDDYRHLFKVCANLHASQFHGGFCAFYPYPEEEKKMQVTNNPNLKFDSLTDEQYRTYEFPNGSKVTISEPVALHVSKSGGHRVLDQAGVSHYIAPTWIHLYWVVKEGSPAFAF